jgi:hypothetical protein
MRSGVCLPRFISHFFDVYAAAFLSKPPENMPMSTMESTIRAALVKNFADDFSMSFMIAPVVGISHNSGSEAGMCAIRHSTFDGSHEMFSCEVDL